MIQSFLRQLILSNGKMAPTTLAVASNSKALFYFFGSSVIFGIEYQ